MRAYGLRHRRLHAWAGSESGWTLAVEFATLGNCTRGRCFLVQRIGRGHIQTPAVYITGKGQLNVQFCHRAGRARILHHPTHVVAGEWFRFMLTVEGQKTTTCVGSISTAVEPMVCVEYTASEIITFDPHDASWGFGGGPIYPTFDGFIRDARLYPHDTFSEPWRNDIISSVTKLDIAFSSSYSNARTPVPARGWDVLRQCHLYEPTRGASRELATAGNVVERCPSHEKKKAYSAAGVAAVTAAKIAARWCPANWGDRMRAHRATLAKEKFSSAVVEIERLGTTKEEARAAFGDMHFASCNGIPDAYYYLGLAHALRIVFIHPLGAETVDQEVESDQAAAFYFILGASRGVVLAQFALAFRMRHGIGVSQDLEYA